MGERVINFPWGYFVTLYKIMCKGSWKYLHTFYAQQWNSHINKLRPNLETLFGTRKFHYNFFCVIDNSYGRIYVLYNICPSHIMLWNNDTFNQVYRYIIHIVSMLIVIDPIHIGHHKSFTLFIFGVIELVIT